MIKLVLGVLLWSGTHLFPALAVDGRKRLVGKLGENGYKGLFVAAMVLSLYLIISGWKATVPEFLYIPPAWGRHAASLLVLIAFILFAASHGHNNIKRLVRHPQLSAVALWGIAHLLANGASRSSSSARHTWPSTGNATLSTRPTRPSTSERTPWKRC